MKKFYKKVSVSKADKGFNVLLDGRSIKTPNKSELFGSTKLLAELSAAEWDAQDEEIIPDSMPVTQLLNTKIDRVSRDRHDMEKLVLNYINTDLLCYRTDNPEELIKRQDEIWQPWLDWFERDYGHNFKTTTGLLALKQPAVIHENIAARIHDMDDDRFTILQMLTPALGSIILALAFISGDASQDDLMNCAYLEEDYKYDLYNEDVHGGDPLTEKKKKALRLDLAAAKSYLNALS